MSGVVVVVGCGEDVLDVESIGFSGGGVSCGGGVSGDVSDSSASDESSVCLPLLVVTMMFLPFLCCISLFKSVNVLFLHCCCTQLTK